MRLSEFILANIEPILVEWESFARSVWPPVPTVPDPAEVRDHAGAILRATVRDMMSPQTGYEQSEKSKGRRDLSDKSEGLVHASAMHASDRVASGFELQAVVAEYRALRGSVFRLWRASLPRLHVEDVDDLTRFNESIDQSLARAVQGYTDRIERSRQMFLAILGHDLRNPLNSMMMAAEYLARTGKLDEEASEVAAQIRVSAVAMGRMIRDLLDFTAGTLGSKIPITPAMMDLAAVCREVVDEMRAANPTCTLQFQTHGDLSGEWDAGRLREVVSNLVGNAIQHGDPCRVDVTVTGEADDVVLTVHNDGTPIPPEIMPTIFNPLVRGEESPSGAPRKSSRPGSLGLGLYIAREVVTAHGGTIDATSSQEAGTTFAVRLPRRRRRPGNPPPAPATAPPPPRSD